MDATITEFTVLMWEYPLPPPIGQCFKGVADETEHGRPIFLKLLYLRRESHRLAEQEFIMRGRPPQSLLARSPKDTLLANGVVVPRERKILFE